MGHVHDIVIFSMDKDSATLMAYLGAGALAVFLLIGMFWVFVKARR